MANIMDYLDWRGDLPLTVSPFNEVDGLILAELSFINFEGIVPPPELGRGVPLRDAAGTYFARHNGQEIDMGVLVPGRIPDLMCRMAHSVRFGGMLLNGYCELMDDAREQQFAALTVELGDGSIYLSYRGTDDTIVGWKEDLNMGYLEVIPSQTRALEYLGRMTRQYPDAKLRIGGHSKGGNLSVYAAVKAPEAVQNQLMQVYNNDGPGFAKPLVGTPEHTRVADRILTVVPQSSVVGQLLEHEQNVEIVRSDAEGMLQHDGFSWQVVGDHFIHLDGFSREGKVIDETLESWEGSLSPKQREAFADALYTVLTASGAKTLSDLNGAKPKSVSSSPARCGRWSARMRKTWRTTCRKTISSRCAASSSGSAKRRKSAARKRNEEATAASAAVVFMFTNRRTRVIVEDILAHYANGKQSLRLRERGSRAGRTRRSVRAAA